MCSRSMGEDYHDLLTGFVAFEYERFCFLKVFIISNGDFQITCAPMTDGTNIAGETLF